MQRLRLMTIVSVAVAIACATNPATGKQLMLVSEAQEIAVGKEADQEAVAAYGLYPDPKIQAYVNELGQRLAAKSERPNLPWSFKVVDDPAGDARGVQGGTLRGEVFFLSYDGKIYQLMGYTPAARFSAYQNAFDASIRSFSRLTDSRYLNVQPKRLELVNLERQMALPEFARAYPSTVEIGTIGLINGVGANQLLPGGELAKRVVGGRLPEYSSEGLAAVARAPAPR